eukprot:TRINITY_DN286_c0_g1_i7.p5 TRINITY_DN286_c0_g1~~TRINITY_DN286_c0_g1_i7.p5  ORF type:complete len:114 (-),score=9.79 TRINITY_DN286_c0_g1_i7:1621-1962(-)
MLQQCNSPNSASQKGRAGIRVQLDLAISPWSSQGVQVGAFDKYANSPPDDHRFVNTAGETVRRRRDFSLLPPRPPLHVRRATVHLQQAGSEDGKGGEGPTRRSSPLGTEGDCW